jgi:hypothetical protein
LWRGNMAYERTSHPSHILIGGENGTNFNHKKRALKPSPSHVKAKILSSCPLLISFLKLVFFNLCGLPFNVWGDFWV